MIDDLGSLMSSFQPNARNPPVQSPPVQPAPVPPTQGAVPPAAPAPSMMMPQQMPDIIQLLIQKALQASPQPNAQVPDMNGLQSAPLQGTTETVGGQ
jgi:hypothetical protein